jgi:hypothetical protein
MHTHSVAKGKGRKGGPLPTCYASCRGVFNLNILAYVLIFVAFWRLENFGLNFGSFLAVLIGVMILIWESLLAKR